MTEAEWNACTDPQPMLDFLRGKASDRKLRLFAVACCRRIWHRLDEVAPGVIEISERAAEGDSTMKDLRALRSQLGARGGYSAAWAANNALHAVLEEQAGIAAGRAIIHAADFLYYFTIESSRSNRLNSQEDGLAAREVERKNLTALVRDIFGPLPFRPVPADSSWLTPTVRALAETIYNERVFDRLPILADAGCTNADILNHCRQPGEHVRGCWVVDLLLGKK